MRGKRDANFIKTSIVIRRRWVNAVRWITVCATVILQAVTLVKAYEAERVRDTADNTCS